jgi:putative ABC transport system permease protein
MVRLSEALKLSFASISSAKLRSALTTLGVIIGVAAVIANISLGASFGQYFEEEIGASGTNFIVVFTQKANVFGDSQFNIVENTRGVAAVSPINQQSATLQYQSAERTATVSGVLPDYEEVGNIRMEHGQFIANQDQNVAVIGSDVAYEKFDRNLSVKNFINISIKNVDGGVSTRTFRVKGIIQDPDASFVSPEVDPSGRVFIPLPVMQEMQHRDDIGGFFIKADSLEILNRVTDDVDENLARSVGVPSRDIDNEDAKPYEIFNQQDILDQINQLSSALTSILVAIALISLIVGSIGIMNIMLVTVTERTKEIGLMKSLGYNYFDILTLFIVESVIISLFGGVFGVLLGMGASMAVNSYLDISGVFPLTLIILGFGISFVVGLISGVYPASKAAKMDPVEALRHE